MCSLDKMEANIEWTRSTKTELEGIEEISNNIQNKYEMFGSFKSFGSCSKSEDNLTKDTSSNQLSLSKFEDFELPRREISESQSSDYFQYTDYVSPLTYALESPKMKKVRTSNHEQFAFNEKIRSLVEYVKNRNETLHCFIDGGGHLKYRDSGTYIFDKRGNLISLSDQEKEYLLRSKFIELGDNDIHK